MRDLSLVFAAGVPPGALRRWVGPRLADARALRRQRGGAARVRARGLEHVLLRDAADLETRGRELCFSQSDAVNDFVSVGKSRRTNLGNTEVTFHVGLNKYSFDVL